MHRTLSKRKVRCRHDHVRSGSSHFANQAPSRWRPEMLEYFNAQGEIVCSWTEALNNGHAVPNCNRVVGEVPQWVGVLRPGFDSVNASRPLYDPTFRTPRVLQRLPEEKAPLAVPATHVENRPRSQPTDEAENRCQNVRATRGDTALQFRVAVADLSRAQVRIEAGSDRSRAGTSVRPDNRRPLASRSPTDLLCGT